MDASKIHQPSRAVGMPISAAKSAKSGRPAQIGASWPWPPSWPQQPASDRDPDQQPGGYCAICAVMALASTVLFATPPALLLPQAAEFLYLTTDADFVHLKSASVAFQPRAPPAS